jgi:hypothetical protein
MLVVAAGGGLGLAPEMVEAILDGEPKRLRLAEMRADLCEQRHSRM